MNEKAKLSKFLKPIKKPALNMLFLKYSNTEPNEGSHLGGFPYITSEDRWPTCPKCEKNMVFFMQLREVGNDGNVILKVFYSCSCQIENFEPTISVIEYTNPNSERCIKLQEGPKTLPYVEIRLEPSWSLPNWPLLPFYDQVIHTQIMSMNNDNAELAEDYYDGLRWDENYLATEPYSLISGYPEFISDPKLVKCKCCNKVTEFVFQLDTDEEFQINWNGGVLYCFRCPKTKTLFFIIN